MCLGIPGRVTEIFDDRDLLCGRVDFAGAVKEVCLAYVPDVRIGEYVIVHVGFAISRLDEEEAMHTLRVLRQMGDLVDQELATDMPVDRELAREGTVDRELARDGTTEGPR